MNFVFCYAPLSISIGIAQYGQYVKSTHHSGNPIGLHPISNPACLLFVHLQRAVAEQGASLGLASSLRFCCIVVLVIPQGDTVIFSPFASR
jgi:hypothetical protein